MDATSVAIIIINWNGYSDTSECLRSLEGMDYSTFKVFLVDNDSTDGSRELLTNDIRSGRYPYQIESISSPGNLGFAGGNNTGIKRASEYGYDYYWLLNNDTTVDKLSLEALVTYMNSHPDVGIVGSKIYYSGSKVIWSAGGTVHSWTGSTEHIGIDEEDMGQFNDTIDVDYVSGCSMLFRKAVLDDIGFMDEDYFLYYEETDWSVRTAQQKWRIVYVPDSVIYHKVSSSSTTGKIVAPYVAYYQIRNRYVMVRRTQPWPKRIVAALAMFYFALKSISKSFIKRDKNITLRLHYILKGILHGMLGKMGKHPTL